MTGPLARMAGAPITWGVCEVAGWGRQLSADRVLREVNGLGLPAIELGPPGFLPDDPAEVARTLRRHDLRLAAGFLPAVLHRVERRPAVIRRVSGAAETLATAGADVLVLAADLGSEGAGYEHSTELSESEWALLLDGLEEARAATERHGLRLALHPHYGTAVVHATHIDRVAGGSDVGFCLDTGHLLVGGTDPVEVARALNGRVSHVHFKDVDANLASRLRQGELGYRDAVVRGLYRPLGDGDLDVAAVVRLLESAKYRGWYVLEQDVVLDEEPAAGNGPASAAARSVHYLTRIMRG